MIFKRIKQLGAVCFLLGSVLLLSGCLDSGLNLMARKHQNRIESNKGVNSESSEEIKKNTGTELSEETTNNNESSEVDKLLEDQTAEKMIAAFFKELGDFVKSVDQLMADKEKVTDQGDGSELNIENSEEGKEEKDDSTQELLEQEEQVNDTNFVEEDLISCEQINSDNCQAGSVVCARVKAQTENGEETEWLEFENACQACQNSSQKIGDMTLEIIGFKEGRCSLP